MPSIAIVGMACRFPDARTPAELWENVLAQRRAFRHMPAERLRMEDYFSADRKSPDQTYSRMAAVIEGYEFDRVRFNVSRDAFASADLTHWLALDIAAQAIADAGYSSAADLPQETTGVFVGNTLTGEFSRANLMRLRWPYVRRTVAATLADAGLDATDELLHTLEQRYKSSFPDVGEETLAGGMSNTIAGRIANHFDLNGGAYALDGACASSLLSLATACNALAAGDLNVAIAGGVDLSLDPFEIVGFAKAGALASDEMRVYDARSSGFWPGEGCGMLVLMREQEALAQRRRIYTVVRGWGISSDGSGGITRPKVEGQLLALQRAYARAGFGPETVPYFEGHGTGTQLGDTTELTVLTRALSEAGARESAVLGSIKANIGHTKAAAGVAGVIKASLALHHQTLPPMTGIDRPHAALCGPKARLRLERSAQPWPAHRDARAAVSAMGFGGINVHVVLERGTEAGIGGLDARTRATSASPQDSEIFLFSAESKTDLWFALERVARFAPLLSYAELADLAAELQQRLIPGEHRAAVVASTPSNLASRLDRLAANLFTDASNEVFYGEGVAVPRIGLLFAGQGAPSHRSGGIWRRRFPCVDHLYSRVHLPQHPDPKSTSIAQPAIACASLAALGVLRRLGVTASLAIGHSLGELTALHWAGAFDEAALLRIATVRGRAMSDLNGVAGSMLSIRAHPSRVGPLLNGSGVMMAAFNSEDETIVSGQAETVAEIAVRARAQGLDAVRLPVSHAFHSPLVAPAARVLAEALRAEQFHPLQGRVISTVTAGALARDRDLRELLERQITEPVRFSEALAAVDKDVENNVDVWIEAGPGDILSKLVSRSSSAPVFPLDAAGPSLRGLLHATAALFTLGAPLRLDTIFHDRFTRPFSLDWQPRFFANPCESAPTVAVPPPEEPDIASDAPQLPDPLNLDALNTVRALVAARCELPARNIHPDSRLLSHLHLNSIVVGQIVAEAARHLQVPPPLAPTEYADSTIAEIAHALEELRQVGESVPEPSNQVPPGVDTWFRSFEIHFVERPLRLQPIAEPPSIWTVIAPDQHRLAEPLRIALKNAPGHGVVLCMPPARELLRDGLSSAPAYMLAAARRVLERRENARFVVVQQDGGAGALCRTLHVEAPEVTCCVVDLPFDAPAAADTILKEALSARAYTEAHYDAEGRRSEPRLRLSKTSHSAASPDLPLTAADVLLVTGGGKGIAAESGLALARASGCSLLLIGRSNAETDPDLKANLQRLNAAAVRYQYISADVTDAAAIARELKRYQSSFRPITALLHGTGTNVPRLIPALQEADFLATTAAKINGLRNVLDSLDPSRLKLLIAFGSLTARVGMRGEADYAVANEWLTMLAQQWQAHHHPHCRCVSLEWSVWSGVGMGERLGRVDALLRQGITPMPVDQALSILKSVLRRNDATVAQLLTGRFGHPTTLQLDRPELPFRRFLERTRTYIPAVELIVESEISTASDPYLADHVYRGEQIFPGVIGLEALTQAAMALLETDTLPVFEQVRFEHPVVIPRDASITIRIAALLREDGACDLVLRSSTTAFQVDHFSARCRCRQDETAPPHRSIEIPPAHLPLEPNRDLYGSLLFHSGRFRRLHSFRALSATECMAEITPSAPTQSVWFWPYLPEKLVLGDPGARDAAIHAIQACIPDSLLLPISIENVYLSALPGAGPLFSHALERWSDGDTFVYDLAISGSDGLVIERWTGLTLKRVEAATRPEFWPVPLFACHLERRITDLFNSSGVSVSLQQPPAETTETSHRLDGKPDLLASGDSLSRAYADDMLLSLRGPSPLACDMETATSRDPQTWRDLLGTDAFQLAEIIVTQSALTFDIAATCVWCALECLKKAEAAAGAPLVFASSSQAGIMFRSGQLAIASFVARMNPLRPMTVFAVLTKVGALDARL